MGSIRLLTYNVKMLPDLATIFGNPWWEKWKTDPARAKLIVYALRDPTWDVVCLQEVFNEDIRKILRRGLARTRNGKPLYSKFVAKSDDGDLFHEDSGLFFASQVAIQSHRFVEFNESTDNDSMADKGILGTVLDTRKRLGGKKLVVFSTHMQANKHPKVRRKQLTQLQRFMQKQLSRLDDPKKYGVIVCGDFNIIAEKVNTDGSVGDRSTEYSQLLQKLNTARDLYREFDKNGHGATWDPPANKKMVRGNQTRKRLDYVFTFNTLPHPDPKKQDLKFAKIKCTDAQIVPFATPDGGNLSDHFGIGVELQC